MAKAGMKRPGSDELGRAKGRKSKNETSPVPEIKGKAKKGHKKAKPT